MARIDVGRAAQVGGFVFRYLWARHRCVGANAPPIPRRLTILTAQGTREFDGIDIEPYKEPPIRRDTKHPDFFRAISCLIGQCHHCLGRDSGARTSTTLPQFPERRAEGVGNMSTRAGISRLIRVV